jgi:pilus assembly protein CpaB
VSVRRRRGLLLLAVALASGGVAASQVHEHERRAQQRLGPSVDVLVAAHDLRAGARLTRGALAFRTVPVRFAPPDALASSRGVTGARVAAPVAAGGYLTASAFAGRGARGGGRRADRGERVVTVEVAGGGGIAALQAGARVDVLVSTETGAGGGRTTMPLAGAELLALDPTDVAEASEPGDPSSGPAALATLRVSLRQAIYLTAADNFAREIRLLPRPAGDHSRAGGAVSQSQL